MRQKQDQAIIKLLNEKEAEGWKKNFASIECGAKLIKSSQSLKHPQHVINKNQDEYMLSECKDQTFFIIELCETIKVMRFEMDNYELYSGTPRNFTVRAVDDFSNNLDDWVVIGNFEASSDKMVNQNFEDFELKAFGKFIRVDVNSHHGTEHFCTLTSFRMFGVSEYEFLHILENEAKVNNEVIKEHEDQMETQSEVEDRLNQLVIQKKTQVQADATGHTTLMSYKHLFLQMRDDVCVDSATFEEFTKTGILKNKDKIQTIEYETMEKKVGSQAGVKTKSINVNENKTQQTEGTNVSAQSPKESILVQISNRVKLLEKNATVLNNILKAFNSSNKQQGNDIGMILETITKAKEVFEETADEVDHVQGKVKSMDKKMEKIESILADSVETTKLMMMITIFLGITCLFLISFICFSPTPQRMIYDDISDVEDDDLTVEDRKPKQSSVPDEMHEEKSKESPKPKKKVHFTDEEMEKGSEEDDISFRMESPIRRTRRRDPLRRSTWCGGSLRRLADDYSRLVAKEF